MKPSLIHEIKAIENSGNVDYHPDTHKLLQKYKQYIVQAREHTYNLERRVMKSEVIPDYNHKHITTLVGRANTGRSSYAMWMVANVFNMLRDDKILWVDENTPELLERRAIDFNVSSEIIGLPNTSNLFDEVRKVNPSMIVIDATCIVNRHGDNTWMKRSAFMGELCRSLNEYDKSNKIRAVLIIDQARGYNSGILYDTACTSILQHSHVAYAINHETGEIETIKNRWSHEKTVYKEIPNHIYDVVHGPSKEAE